MPEAENDLRFPPVRQDELHVISLEISVLSPLLPIVAATPTALLAAIRPGIDGLVLEKDDLRSTFLPQVWEQVHDPIEFLEQLALKAGLESDDWKTARFKRYTVEHFEE